MLRKLISILVCVMTLVATQVQAADNSNRVSGIFNHLEAGLSVGSTGIGLNLSTPVTDYVKIRTGVEFMPHFAVPMSFSIASYSNGAINESNFTKLQDLMRTLSGGIEVDQTVKMKGTGKMIDFKFLVDVYPWKQNKHWHFTAGFYYGASKVAHAENYIDEMPSLLAMKIYNNFYERVLGFDFINQPLGELFDFGFVNIPALSNTYLDPDKGDELKAKIESYGRLGVHVGDKKSDGKPFLMEPGKDGMVKADLIVNKFKPYLGVGYDAPISKDKRWNIGFDAGVLFWGAPKLITHQQPLVGSDGIAITKPNASGENEIIYGSCDLINDVSNIKGKVGTYVGIASALTVYPVINFKISFKIL